MLTCPDEGLTGLDLERTQRSKLPNVDSHPKMLSIKNAALESGVSAHTLRYYERIGLLPTVGRDDNGQRRYTAYDLGLIDILTKLRATGMSIQGMQRFAALIAQGDDVISDRRELLETHRSEVREHIQKLEANLITIDAKIALYHDLEAGRISKSAPCAPSEIKNS
jgi:DNA-binding transcriptional MerR regulator